MRSDPDILHSKRAGFWPHPQFDGDVIDVFQPFVFFLSVFIVLAVC